MGEQKSEQKCQKVSAVHGTAHWNNGGINADYSPAYYGGSKTKTDGKTLADQFHVFSIVWTRDSIIWYLDDVQYHIMALNNSADLAPFRKEFFFIFNIAVGGNWPGYPDSTTVFPQRMVVDYVRVFQQNQKQLRAFNCLTISPLKRLVTGQISLF